MDKIWLLGRWISFLAKDINKVLGIPEVKQSEEISRMRVDKMSEMLFLEGTKWKIKNGKFCYFLKRDMSLEAQTWLYFICALHIPEEGHEPFTYVKSLPPITGKTLARITIEVTRERGQSSKASSMERKRPLKALKEEVAKLKEKVAKQKDYNMAMWKLWEEKNNIPEEELPVYET